jgi:predicted transposase/invertase (TIGR01784 family)
MSVKKPPKERTVKKTKYTTPELFDRIFKQLLQLSGKAVILFINGLFGVRYPMDSDVEFMNTETVNGKMRRRLRDSVVEINGIPYHIEVQAGKDPDMAVRMFLYAFDRGVSKCTYENGIRTVEFASARIINLQSTEKKREFEILRLKNPGKPDYDYEVENFNLLAHSVKQLEKKGLAILLPFYILKLRERVKKAAPGLERKKLSVPLRKLLDELVVTVDACKQKGAIDEKDAHGIIKGLDFLYQELYSQYEELAQEDSMLREKLFETGQDLVDRTKDETSLEIAKNLLKRGTSPEIVSADTGLPLAKVKALLKEPKSKRTA